MRRLLALIVVVLLVLVFGVGQLVLPGIAASRVRASLARHGQVLSVSVSAFPAIKLLWHHADTVVVRMATYRSTPSGLGPAIGQASDVGTLDASAQVFQDGLLTLHNAVVHKQGDLLTGAADVRESDLRSVLPVLDSVTPMTSSDGQLTLRGTATVLGLTATVDATVSAQNGNVVVAPDVPLGGFLTVTAFSDPRVYVERIAASQTTDGFALQGTAVLR